MSGPDFLDITTMSLRQAIALRQKNQQVIASNIANAETPGYRPLRFNFEQALAGALKHQTKQLETRPQHLSTNGHISSVKGKLETVDGAVNVDQEMIALSENQILYEAAIEMLNKKLALIKYVAQDGR